MPQLELLSRVLRALDESECPYMLTGSFASSMQGEPRLSHDIDLVVDFKSRAVPAFMKHFPPPEFHLDEQSIRQAIAAGTMFSLLRVSEGDRVDFWMLTDDPFDISRFSRRQSEDALGIKLFISSPEDTILVKLRWAKISGGSEKQFHDALRVYEVQYGGLDLEYLKRWVHTLGVERLWARLLREAAPL